METIKETNKPIYNPTLSYQWGVGEQFSLLGTELEYMFQTTIEFLNKPDSIHVLKMLEFHKILESKIKEGVEKGVVKAKE